MQLKPLFVFSCAVLWIWIRICMDPRSIGCPGSGTVWGMQILIREHQNWPNLSNKPGFLPFKKLLYLCRCVFWATLYFKYIFNIKIHLFDFKVRPGSEYGSAWNCTGFAPLIRIPIHIELKSCIWIRIHIELKSWIWIRIRSETKANPQHWIIYIFWLPSHANSVCYGIQFCTIASPPKSVPCCSVIFLVACSFPYFRPSGPV